MEKKTQILQLFPSKKVNGDLIAYMPTTKGHSMIIVIDKNCENFPLAAPKQLWQMDISIKSGENFGIATLLQPVDIECRNCYEEQPSFQVLVKGTNQPIFEIVYPEGEYNAFVKGMLILHAKKAGLAAFDRQIVHEYRELFEVYKTKMDEAREAVFGAITLCKENTDAPKDCAYEILQELEVLNEAWKLVKIDQIPSCEDLAANLVESGLFFKNNRFVRPIATVSIETEVQV